MRSARPPRDEGCGARYLAETERAAVAAIPAIEKVVFGTEDFKEGLQSFVERREARFRGR